MNVSRGHDLDRPSGVPELRPDPFEPSEHDDRIAEWVKHKWHSQDEMLRGRDRQVEENVRMLLGQHWIVWSELRGRFVDVSEYFTDKERRWRQLPVVNRLFLWFMLIHARTTENPPVITFQPGPDRIDSQLAEVMDPVYKYLWRETKAIEVLDRLFAWLIPSGRGHIKSRIDPHKGDFIEFQQDATLSLLGPDGQPIQGQDGQPIQRTARDVPFGPDGEPRAELVEDGEDYGYLPTGEPHTMQEGGISLDVLTCLEVRGEWGQSTPWEDKRFHIQKTYLTPEQAFEAYGMELEPDVRGQQAEDSGVLMKLLYSTGIFGAADQTPGSFAHGATSQEFVTIYELWHKPSNLVEGMQRTPKNPGGRLAIVTGNDVVIRDGPRFAPFRYTSPIRCFDFVNLPGRPQGTSPQEMLNGPVRTRNRLYGQFLDHATKSGNPIEMIDKSTGLKPGDVEGTPGEQVFVNMEDLTGDPIRYAKPPEIGRSVPDAIDRLGLEIDDLGNIAGSRGEPPTKDASGELIKELRFNSDRFIGPTLRRGVLEMGRLAEDWMVMLPLIWDTEKIIDASGEDGIARTITVLPKMFEQGSVNVEPEIESMLPEGRGERQQRVYRMWKDGVWGDPASPAAINTFLDLARFPHMSQATRPGGVDRSTAEQNVGALLQGTPAAEIPVYEWYDHDIHLFVLERFMKSPEYKKMDLEVQQEMVVYRMILQEAQMAAAINDQERQMKAQQATAAMQMAAQKQIGDAAREGSPEPQGEGEPGGQGPPARGATSEPQSGARGAA